MRKNDNSHTQKEAGQINSNVKKKKIRVQLWKLAIVVLIITCLIYIGVYMYNHRQSSFKQGELIIQNDGLTSFAVEKINDNTNIRDIVVGTNLSKERIYNSLGLETKQSENTKVRDLIKSYPELNLSSIRQILNPLFTDNK